MPRSADPDAAPDFRRIPTILTAPELLDKAFHKASRISIYAKDPFERIRTTEIARLRSAENTLDATLAKWVKAFPSFERMPPFYRDLARVLVDVDAARKALGAIDWARGQILNIADEAVGRMKRARTDDVVVTEKKKAYGRISSLVDRVGRELAYLNEVRDALKRMPTVDPAVPTIVVAGYPNVGKSSFIRRVSTAEPEVAPYPFTTRGIGVGHFTLRRVTFQVVDTPGLLDRPLEERNPIERQAIAALEHLGDSVVFLLDPSELCGYPMDAQERLLEETRRVLGRSPFVVVENKVDVADGKFTGREDRLRMSTQSGEGVDVVLDTAARAALAAWQTRSTE